MARLVNTIRYFQRIVLFAVLLIVPVILSAQTYEDALRFNGGNFPANARSAGMANAGGAAGAQSVSHINPAGLSFYRNSEFTISSGFNMPNSEVEYLNNTESATDFGLNIPQISLILHEKLSSFGQQNEVGWVNFNIGISIERQNSFLERTTFSGMNESTSITQAYAEQATGTFPESLPWVEFMAWELFLIDNPDEDNQYISVVDQNENPDAMRIEQSREVTRSGRNNHLNFAFSGNYSNRLYLGGALTFPRIKYKHSTVFDEINKSENINIYQGMTFRETTDASGWGVRGSLGAIYRFTDWFRFGAAFKTPAAFRIKEEFTLQMSSRSTDLGEELYEDEPLEFENEYKYITPAEWSVMTAFIAENIGMLSFEASTRDHSSMYLDSDEFSYRAENNLIRDVFIRSYSFKVGTEVPVGPFAFRGGYIYDTSPYHTDYRWKLDNGTKHTYSGGIGMRFEEYSIDLAYIRGISDEIHQPYSLETQVVEPAEITRTQNTLILSGSVRF